MCYARNYVVMHVLENGFDGFWIIRGWTLASVFEDNPVQLGLKLDISLYFDNNQLASPIVEYV
jgi:hypothetical protein